jgi:hypothetical protein
MMQTSSLISNLVETKEFSFLKDSTPEEFLLFFKKNKVPLATLFDSQKIQDEHELLQKAYASQHDIYTNMLLEYKRVYSAWQAKGITGVLIKSSGKFPYTSDNIDVLVPVDRADEAKEILINLGYVELYHIREPFKDLFRIFTDYNISYAIHVHTSVGWINRFFSDREIIESARTSTEHPEVLYPSPEHCFLINMAHWFYEDKEIKLRDIVNAMEVVKGGLDWDMMRSATMRGGWRDGYNIVIVVYNFVSLKLLGYSFIPENVYQGSLSDLSAEQNRFVNRLFAKPITLPFYLSKWFCKKYHFKVPIHNTTIGVREKALEVTLLLKFALQVKLTPWLRQRPLSVNISGTDYSGKTTLARNVQILLDTSSIRSSHCWLRVGTSPVLELLKFPFRRAANKGNSGESKEMKLSRRVFKGNRAIAYLWVTIVQLDVLLRTWFYYIANLVRGEVIIFDRFKIDHMVDLSQDYSIPIDSFVFKLSSWLYPRTNVSVVLVPDERLLRARIADEEERNRIRERISIYRRHSEKDHSLPVIPFGDFRDCNQLFITIVNHIFPRKHVQ